MKRCNLFFHLLLPALIAAMPALPQTPGAAEPQAAAPAFAKHGPHWVGTREFVVKTTEGRSLPATLWYPALNPKGLKEVNTVFMDNAQFGGTDRTFSGHALQDAEPDSASGPCPLVVYSHGAPGTRADAVPLMEHWASHGLAVLAVDHGKYELYRSSDLKGALDFAEQLTAGTGPFARHLDTQRMAAAGFSFGGLSVLTVGGVHFAGLSGEPQDPRLKALLLLAPEDAGVKAKSLDLNAATLPALVMVGSKDERFSEVEQVYQGLPAPRKSLVTLLGSTHEVFLDPFLKTFYADLDPGTLPADRAQSLIHHFTTAFLLDVLKGDGEAHKALLPGTATFPEVAYRTTLR